MPAAHSPRSVPALVLVGGLGTRLRSVSGNLPKPMVPVAGRPFLEHLLRFLRAHGILRVVLCVGHGADAIETAFGTGSGLGLELAYSREQELLGTGGAMKQGAELAEGAPLLVLNGDSFVALDLGQMISSHQGGGTALSVALAQVPDTTRFGAVELDSSGRIRRFGEKAAGGPGLINAGVYLMERAVIDSIPAGVASFERDVLPRVVAEGARGFVTGGFFIDIGVPEDYRRIADDPAPFLAAVSAAGAR